MMPHFQKTVFLLCFLTLPLFLHAQWESVPVAVTRQIVKLDTFQNQLAMLDDAGSLYLSANQGLTWKHIFTSPTNNQITFTFAGVGSTLVALTEDGIYKSLDNGQSWTHSNQFYVPPNITESNMVSVGADYVFFNFNSNVYRLKLSSNDLTQVISGGKVYKHGNAIWTRNSTLKYSTNAGYNWQDSGIIPQSDYAFQGDTVWYVKNITSLESAYFSVIGDPSHQEHVVNLPPPPVNGYSILAVSAADGYAYLQMANSSFRYNPISGAWEEALRLPKDYSAGSMASFDGHLFNLSSRGVLRREPVTGHWYLNNTGLLSIYSENVDLRRLGNNLYGSINNDSYRGFLQTGPQPVWVTPFDSLIPESIMHANDGYYAWDDSSRLWFTKDNLWEWTKKGPGLSTILPVFGKAGRLFGTGGDTLFSTSNSGIFWSKNKGIDWENTPPSYLNLGSDGLVSILDSVWYYVDQYGVVARLDPKTGVATKKGTLPFPWPLPIFASRKPYIFAGGSGIYSPDNGQTWGTWDAVDNTGHSLSLEVSEVCEAGYFGVVNPSSNAYAPGLYYAPGLGDPFVKIDYPPLDTLTPSPEWNVKSMVYCDGYLYVSHYHGLVFRRHFDPVKVYDFGGHVWRDDNDNGIWDPTEPPMKNLVVARNKYVFQVTNDHGAYSILDNLDQDTLHTTSPWPGWTVKPPFRAGNIPGDTLDFRIVPPYFRNFSLDMELMDILKPLQPAAIIMHWQNLGAPHDATVRLIIPGGLENWDEAFPKPDLIVGDTAIWQIQNVQPVDEGYIVVFVVTKWDAPVGDVATFHGEILPIATDEVPSDNVVETTGIILSPWDPNAKLVEPKKYTHDDLQGGRPLTYTIHFQNTGNYQASLVYIRDTISDKLDPSTLHVLSASHPYTWNFISGRVAEFLFNPINLPDSVSDEHGSHGYIKYSIKPYSNLPVNSDIANTANIFFDFNAPIRTNTVHTIIEIPIVSTHAPEPGIVLIAPNPTTGRVEVRFPAPATGISVCNGLGEVLKEHHFGFPTGSTQLDLSDLPPGMYWIRASLEGGKTAVGKVVKD